MIPQPVARNPIASVGPTVRFAASAATARSSGAVMAAMTNARGHRLIRWRT